MLLSGGRGEWVRREELPDYSVMMLALSVSTM